MQVRASKTQHRTAVCALKLHTYFITFICHCTYFFFIWNPLPSWRAAFGFTLDPSFIYLQLLPSSLCLDKINFSKDTQMRKSSVEIHFLTFHTYFALILSWVLCFWLLDWKCLFCLLIHLLFLLPKGGRWKPLFLLSGGYKIGRVCSCKKRNKATFCDENRQTHTPTDARMHTHSRAARVCPRKRSHLSLPGGPVCWLSAPQIERLALRSRDQGAEESLSS